MTAADLAEHEEAAPILSRVRAQASELPAEIRLSGEDTTSDFRRRSVSSRRLEGGSRQIDSQSLPVSSSVEVLTLAAEKRLYRIWSERERLEFSLGPDHVAFDPGDVISLAGIPEKTFETPLLMRINAIEDAGQRRVEAVRIAADLAQAGGASNPAADPYRDTDLSPPLQPFWICPNSRTPDPDDALRLAAYASPWPGGFAVLRSVVSSGFDPLMSLPFPAVMGELIEPLFFGPIWHWDRTNRVVLKLYSGQLQSRSELEVLSGANAIAVECVAGGFEILQFQSAELVAPGTYSLSGLLRGQRGTEPEMKEGALAGARVVVLSEERVPLVPLDFDQAGLGFNYRLVPHGRELNDPASLAMSHASSARAARPMAPVHLRARRLPDGLQLSWVRQTRQGGDNWDQLDVPLAEEIEAYEVDILSGVDVIRTLSADTSRLLYSSADETADFGSIQSSLTFSVAQVSRRVGRGAERKATLHV